MMAMRGSASLTAETILCQYGTKRHAQLHKVLLHQLSTTISVVKQRCLVVVHFLQQGFFLWRERQRRENRPTFYEFV
jgi:hypothetical protein